MKENDVHDDLKWILCPRCHTRPGQRSEMTPSWRISLYTVRSAKENSLSR